MRTGGKSETNIVRENFGLVEKDGGVKIYSIIKKCIKLAG